MVNMSHTARLWICMWSLHRFAAVVAIVVVELLVLK